MKTANELLLDRRVMKASVLMEFIVKADFGLRWWKPKHEDNLRLLRLLQWEEKYQISARWAVDILVPIWKAKYAKYQRNGIGVTIATLVGKKSEEILVECIGKQFPSGEHREQWKAREQNRQWRAMQEEKRSIDWREPLRAMRQYLTRMDTEREEFRKFSQDMKRRNYRGNPWL